MSFDAANLLGGLFAGNPSELMAAPAPEAPAVVPPGEPAADRPDGPEPASRPPLRQAELSYPSAVWARDCRGRLGAERPGLPAWQAWWRRRDFDDLPEVSDGLDPIPSTSERKERE